MNKALAFKDKINEMTYKDTKTFKTRYGKAVDFLANTVLDRVDNILRIDDLTPEEKMYNIHPSKIQLKILEIKQYTDLELEYLKNNSILQRLVRDANIKLKSHGFEIKSYNLPSSGIDSSTLSMTYGVIGEFIKTTDNLFKSVRNFIFGNRSQLS